MVSFPQEHCGNNAEATETDGPLLAPRVMLSARSVAVFVSCTESPFYLCSISADGLSCNVNVLRKRRRSADSVPRPKSPVTPADVGQPPSFHMAHHLLGVQVILLEKNVLVVSEGVCT